MSNIIKVPTANPLYYMNVRYDSPSDFLILREIFSENVYEVYDGDLDDTGIVIDIGANIGAFSIYAISLRPDKNIKVFAVEPELNNYNLLVDNTKELNVIPIKKAVGGKHKWVKISNEHGHSNIYGDDGEDVLCVTLDELVKELDIDYADILKIDVEGAESEILLPASTETLNKFRYITMEFDKNDNKLGEIIEKISQTHQIKIVGKAGQGGMVYAKRY